jgi:hypothetical protein
VAGVRPGGGAAAEGDRLSARGGAAAASALRLLKSDPARFRAYNAPNGWGLYEHFVPFVEQYLEACREHPDATVKASR